MTLTMTAVNKFLTRNLGQNRVEQLKNSFGSSNNIFWVSKQIICFRING